MESFRRQIPGTAVWCLLIGGVRLWEVSVGRGSTTLVYFSIAFNILIFII